MQILIVEDNNADALLITEAIKGSNIIKKYQVVKDGESALKYLNAINNGSKEFLPDLIILDLSLPKKSGFEVLTEIKNNSLFKKIPVVILTCSDNQENVKKCYSLHANCYLVKPIELKEYEEMFKTIESFWGEVAALPNLN